MKKATRWLSGLLSAAMIVGTIAVNPVTKVEAADGYPEEILLGSFCVSEADATDILYWSLDGENFYELSRALEDTKPDDPNQAPIDTTGDCVPERGWNVHWLVNTLRDPSLAYFGGRFWMISGWCNGEGDAARFIPMLSYSNDLVRWSFPDSGTQNNVKLSKVPAGAAKNGGKWSIAGSELFIDDDGTFWVIFSAGYFAAHFGDSNPQNDEMSPYICKIVTNITYENGVADLSESRGYHTPRMEYSEAVPINLPSLGMIRENDRIDPAIYKENGKYYMTIKRNGISNEIWEYTGKEFDLEGVQNASNWKCVNTEAVKGTEGPSIVKFNGKYMMYTDKLASYLANYDGKTGIRVTTADTLEGLNGTYGDVTGDPIVNIKNVQFHDKNGNVYEGNRHGTVIKLTNTKAIKKVWQLAVTTRYKDVYAEYANPVIEEVINPEDAVYPEPHKTRFEKGKDGKYYWYENDIKQGTVDDPLGIYGDGTNRGREICDLVTSGWYWLDACYDGAKACNKEVWMPYIYHDEAIWSDEKIHKESLNSGVQAEQVEREIKAGRGKWVRYDEYGRMYKGWYTVDDEQKEFFPDQYGNTYYYDIITGLMARGTLVIDGYTCVFDETTGVLKSKTPV